MNTLMPARAVAATLAVTVPLVLGGCTTTGGLWPASNSAPLTPAEQQMQQDEERFRDTMISGVLLGAAGGAVIGAVGALAVGGNSKNARNAAIVGGVVGGAVVGADAYATAKKEQAGREKIRASQAAANDVRQDNQRLRAYLASSRRVLTEGKARLATLQTNVKAQRLSVAEAEKARAREQRNIDSMQKTLAEARKTREEYADASAKLADNPQDRRDLDDEIKRMDSQINLLEANVQEYSRALAVSQA